MSTRPQDIASGRVVSHYEIQEPLGRGGMAVVYRAWDLHLRQHKALKFISSELAGDEHARHKFKQEALAASALDHPNICTIHDIDETSDGRMYIAMAYYDGESLDRRIGRGPLPEKDAVEIARQIAHGLASAHAHGIVHRDVKPANLMITRDGLVKILDFGVAKLRPESPLTDLTLSGEGVIVGTSAYMSPEQARGDKDIDARSDLFSLGIVLYEMLTGRRPFDADKPLAAIYQILNATPPPMTSIRAGLNRDLQKIVDRCLQKDPAARYPSAGALRDDLDRVLAGIRVKIRHHYVRRASRVGAIAGAVALAGWGTSKWVTPGVPEPMHVAVLPFENVGGDPANQAFCDGLMETMAWQLSQMEQFRPEMWIIPSSVVRAEKVANPADAHRLLGVNLVVTGAVQRIADRVRVTLSLVDVAEGATPRQVKSVMLDNTIWKATTLQDEAAMRLAGMMQMDVKPQEERAVQAGVTRVSAAYDYYLQGVGYVRAWDVEGNLDRAIDAFSMAIDHDSSYALAHAGLGEAYWRQYKDRGDPAVIEHAREHAARAVALDSLVAPAHVTLGLVLAGTGRAEEAIAEFNRAVALDPASDDAVRELASAYAAAARPADAEATFRRAITMRPDYWGTHHEMGMFYYRQGEYAKAIAEFQQVARLNPGNKFAWNNMGGCYWALDDLDRARDMFQKSIDVEPNHRAYSNLGAYYTMRQSWAEAARMCEQAVKLNPGEYRSYVNLGNAYYWTPGQREKAMATYRRAVALMEEQRRITPKNVGLLTSLEACYAVLGDKERATGLIGETLRIDAESQRVLYYAGHSCEQMGQRDRALEFVSRAIDAGYPLSEIDSDPWLHDFRDDARWAAIHERALQHQREKK